MSGTDFRQGGSYSTYRKRRHTTFHTDVSPTVLRDVGVLDEFLRRDLLTVLVHDRWSPGTHTPTQSPTVVLYGLFRESLLDTSRRRNRNGLSPLEHASSATPWSMGVSVTVGHRNHESRTALGTTPRSLLPTSSRRGGRNSRGNDCTPGFRG